jgi:hypothetical protein
MPELVYFSALVGLLRAQLAQLRADERGSLTTEQVLVTAALAALALATTAIIVSKVTAKANSIPMQ